MWFIGSSLEICISATVFYSTVFTSKCQADDIPGYLFKNNEESIHIYRTEIPWTPIQFEKDKNNFAIVAWIAVLSVAVSVVTVLCFCYLCWKLYPRYSSRRQSSNAALVSSPASGVTYPDNQEGDRGRRNSSRTGNYRTGVMNFAFTNDPRDPISNSKLEDGPPAYSIVISQIPSSDNPTNTPYPEVIETKKVETPPPAYVTVAPFQ